LIPTLKRFFILIISLTKSAASIKACGALRPVVAAVVRLEQAIWAPGNQQDRHVKCRGRDGASFFKHEKGAQTL
jgi:hypothetical protein